ncbi:VOC family protein [Pontibacter sp. E15-1]|uniref:VOC family protein n=1 Tax=Pontibacter sp. E15-1 TaxID=2919918 RepID=UPI001F4F8006|nr:VOC family protein [Pontibacter sp. E15-1]MCJ8165605.1 VOC family protein [Pontibacter sp. E15-1]
MAANGYNPFQGAALTTILVVTDINRSKAFYVDVLGAELYRAYGGTSVVLQFLGNWLLLVSPGGPTEDKPETAFVMPQDANKVSHCFTIQVQDCQKSYETLKAKGVAFLTPPKQRGTETRCFFRDPDGHLFEISEHEKQS